VRGRRADEVGDSARAKEHFASAFERFKQALEEADLRAPQAAWQARYACGRARFLAGDVRSAEDFFASARLALEQQGLKHAPTYACLAYCAAYRGRHNSAITLGNKALEQGERRPGILSNLAYSHSRAQKGLPEAQKLLSEALRSAPDFEAALLIRAEMALKEQLGVAPRPPVPSAALEVVDAAIRRRRQKGTQVPVSLYALGAQLYLCSLLDLAEARGPVPAGGPLPLDSRVDRAHEYLQEGLGPRPTFIDELVRQALSGRARPADLSKKLPRTSWRGEALSAQYLLIDPLGAALE
jgi:tetratricopeptide (TPR) repeat protein